jgi:glycosyltransferase involved in cell wall biosynthesis
MIYVCIPSYDEAPTIGLLLWKIRQVFAGFPREYQLLVADDDSSDATAEVLEPYARVLPLSIVRHERRRGYAATVEELLRLAVERTDRPKRDGAILMHADFAHAPSAIPDLVRRLESGADMVVAESAVEGQVSRTHRLLRRAAPLLLGRRLRVAGVRDLVSGFLAFRLVTLRNAFRAQQGPLLTREGWCANAELIARTARAARRVDTVRTVERHDLRRRQSRVHPGRTAVALWRARNSVVLPPGSAPPPAAEPASAAREEPELAS